MRFVSMRFVAMRFVAMRFRFVVLLLTVVAPVFADRCSADSKMSKLYPEARAFQRAPARDELRRVSAARPGDLDALYLYAHSLVGRDTRAALHLFRRVLAQDPEYPWVHLSQLLVYRSPGFRDRKKLQESFLVVRRVCPSVSEPWRYLGEIHDLGLVAKEAALLRAFLADSKDPKSFPLYRMLWSAEFQVHPKQEHEAVRRTIAADVQRLREFEATPEALGAAISGARLAGNEGLAKELETRRKPDLFQQYSAWQEANPRPAAGDSAEKKRAYAQSELQAAEGWIAAGPNEPIGYAMRLRALVELEADAEVLGRAGNELLAVERRRGVGVKSFFLGVARAYLARGVLLDQALAILEEAIQSFDDPEAAMDTDLSPSPGYVERTRTMHAVYHAEAVVMLSELHERRGEMEKAREAMDGLRTYLTALGASKGTAWFSFHLRSAKIAERENRKADALGSYLEAYTAAPIRQAEMLAAQRRLWKELGRSDRSWNERVEKLAVRADPRQVRAVRRAVPEFSVKVIEGRPWTLAQFKGKTPIAVVWATWCTPCPAELPYVEKSRLRWRDGRMCWCCR